MKIPQIKNISPQIFTNIFFLILSVVALLQPAICNHYPLCHPDLGSYLVSGFEKTVDQFRPFLYGFLLRHISMGHSLWFVVVFQAIIFSFSVFLMFKYVFSFKNSMFKTFIAITILSSLTTMAFYVCHVIADIYSGLGIIAVIILFNPNKNHWLLSVYAMVLMLVSGLVHYSNLGTYTVIILALSIFYFAFIRKKWNPYDWKKLIIPLAAVCSLWILMPSMNKVYGGANRITSNNEIIHMARLIETGIASEYLHDKCGDHNYELCNYIDYVDSRPHPSAFVWNFSESPIYKGDCRWAVVCWEEKAKEYKIIIDDMLKTPKYRKMIIWRIGIDGTYRQFIKFGHQTLQRQRAGTPAFITIKKYFPNEFQQFYFALQQDGQEWKNFNERNFINKWTVILSAFIILIFILLTPLRKSINTSVLAFLIVSFLYLTVNAATCSIFSSVSPRYQDRIIWLVPMAAIILIINYYNYSKKRKNAL